MSRKEFAMGDQAGLVRLGAGVFGAMVALAALGWGTGLGAGDRGRDEEPEPRASAQIAPVTEREKEGKKGGAVRADGVCTVTGAPVALPDAVHEAGGVAGGRRRNEGILWTRADSGEPQVLALSLDGAPRGTVRIAGARVEDWEDVSVGPCAAGSCLFVGDIGDNSARGARITIYRVPEPEPGSGTSAPAEALHATYPDGAHDAEAFFVAGDGRIYVVTKGETGPAAVYRFPASPAAGSESRLEHVRALNGRVGQRERITGADVSPDGRWVALRTLEVVDFHPFTALTGGAEGAPLRYDLSPAREAQGEGIALGAGGAGYLASEGGR